MSCGFLWFSFCLFVLDLYLLYRIGLEYGALAVLAILFLPAMLGGRLARSQGRRCWQQVEEELAQGRPPSQKLAESAVILAAGLLLILPGPISTVLGLALLVPGIRRLAARVALGRWQQRIATQTARTGASGAGPVFVRVVTQGSVSGGPAMPGSQGLKPVEGRDVTNEIEKPRELPPGPTV